ncbi:hypothetical protein M422DRAFT_268863 [Sphaerobolus stellatus SS14]|uniref:Cytochrome P450 n=1 Tax=Sphaerobolus stellatus (strain SS14) TaxID=990650 RepID=A0A0C9U609_SPHS4|nr:hypothetical protein M422DRAFT_268863 [Sphaerobolus stellatus SS14]
MDEPKAEEQSLNHLATRILVMNFASVQTTSTTFVHALYYLALRTNEYLEPYGLKETLRMHPVATLVVFRTTLKGYTFSNGTLIPKGTMVSVPTESAHYDQNNYQNAAEFIGFRYVDKSELEGGTSRRHDVVSTSGDFMSFGIGRHACPGKIFAAIIMNIMMLAHLVLNYDLKLEHEGVRPKDIYIGATRIPHPKAAIMLKKRV